MQNRLTTSMIIFFLFVFASCATSKNVAYFHGQGDVDIVTKNLAPVATIQSNDLLSIMVTSISAQSSSNTFNTVNTLGSNGNIYAGISQHTNGYLVDQEGYIKLPYLGRVQVAGLSDKQLEDLITAGILEQKLMIDPIVTVRPLNFKVTVLGEVGHPTVINVPNKKISVLEALGMAGDLTIYAKRDNVLLIREEDGKKITRRLNLHSSDILNSPYYYLKSNDVLYVEPNNAKVASVSRSRQILPIIFSALSFGVVVLDRLTR